MVSTKKALRRALRDEASHSEGVSPLAVRLLSENELDWVGGAMDHSMTIGVYAMGGGNGSYTQTGGSFTQNGDNQFYVQSSGSVTQNTPRNLGGD
jgi:hypothetical protein